MNLSNLQYFLDVVETGTISQAARKNYMSQQALSDRIRRLEKHYRMPLLERTNPVRLTPAGELVCRTAHEVLGAMEKLDRQLEELEKKQAGRLVISTGLTAMPPFLPDVMVEFHKRMPGIELLIIHPSSLEAELTELPPEADLLLGNLPFGESVEVVELFRDKLCIALSEELLERKYGADWERYEAVLRARRTVCEWEGMPIGIAQCNGRRIVEVVQCSEQVSSSSMELVQHFCQIGQCAAVVPIHFAHCIFSGVPQVRFYPLEGEAVEYCVAIGTRRGQPCSRAAEVFIRTAVEYFQKDAAKENEYV